MADGVVYIASTTDGRLHALAADTGMERWRFAIGDPDFSATEPVGGTLYVGIRSEVRERSLHARDATTGNAPWRFETGVERAYATVVKGAVYASTGVPVYALDGTTGAERWRFQKGRAVGCCPVVVDCLMFVQSDNGFLYVMDDSAAR